MLEQALTVAGVHVGEQRIAYLSTFVRRAVVPDLEVAVGVIGAQDNAVSYRIAIDEGFRFAVMRVPGAYTLLIPVPPR
jgi:hypothetical protein